MRSRREYVFAHIVLAMALALSACSGRETSGPTPAPSSSPTPKASPVEKIEATPEAVKKAEAALQNAAERGRRGRACLGFDDFRSTVYREPFEGGKYIVNGDTPILNEKQLREFFEQRVKPPQLTALILAQVSGMDAKWNQQQKRKLTYCVSRTFDQRYDKVVQDMESATGEWKRWAAIEFVHDPAQDPNCGPSNEAVVFDVRPVNVNEEYLARAFFPNEPRAARNVLIDESTFALPPGGNLQLAGVLRHELGHTLGFRHEHTRPDSGTCFEDRDWRPLTDYDAFSVMHYPQCNGKGDWSLNLTDKDKNGAACVYGAAPGFTIDTTVVVDVSKCASDQPGAPSPNQPQTESFNAQSVAKGAQKQYGPFAVAASSLFEVSMGGSGATGDPDLYVRFGAKPSLTAYDCRPFLVGPVEVCSLNVPADSSQAFVMVNGYAAGTYDLQVTRVPPATALRRPAAGTPK